MFLIEGLELPAKYDRRVNALDDIADRFGAALSAEFDASPASVVGRAGYRYASIPAVCPDCGADLVFSNGVIDAANGAVAVATCRNRCGWTGRGVFRLIDLVDDDQAGESAVATGTLQPAYQPY